MTAPTTEPADATADEPVEAVTAEQEQATAPVPAPERGARAWARSAIAADGAPRPVWLVAPLAAIWSALIGLAIIVLPMIAMWAMSVFEGVGFFDSMRTAGLIWVVTHDVALRVGAATFSLLPWGVMLLWLWLLVIAGKWAARAAQLESVRDGAILVVVSALVYGALLGGASSFAVIADARTSPIRAFGIGFALAALGTAWGALRGSALGELVRERIPAVSMVILRGALAGVSVLVGAGAILAAVALGLGFSQALQMQSFLNAGAAGGLALFILGLGYLPVAVMWSVAYALGAGVSIGPDVVLSPFMQSPAPTSLPAFPLLAALPQQASPIAWALPLIGILAGIVIGLLIARAGGYPALHRAGIAVAAVVIAAIALAILTRMSFGSMGQVRLIGLGPSSQTVALIAGGLMLIGALPSALVAGRQPKPVDV